MAVVASVLPAFGPVKEVMLHYRVMFGPEQVVPMLDDGAHSDGPAGDGVYGASIPANAATEGQLIRYYVTASDTTGGASRATG